MEKKELSPLAKQLLGGAGHIEVFTQTEFDDALAVAKAEIMMVAIETTKKAIQIERDACADLALEWSQEELSVAIRNRMKPKETE